MTNKSANIKERRQFPRFDYENIQIWKDLTSNMLNCKAKNLSAAGVCVLLDEELEIATKFGIKITLPDKHRPITCNGKINWTMARADRRKYPPYEYETGIEFTDIRKVDRYRIIHYSESKLENLSKIEQ